MTCGSDAFPGPAVFHWVRIAPVLGCLSGSSGRVQRETGAGDHSI